MMTLQRWNGESKPPLPYNVAIAFWGGGEKRDAEGVVPYEER